MPPEPVAQDGTYSADSTPSELQGSVQAGCTGRKLSRVLYNASVSDYKATKTEQ